MVSRSVVKVLKFLVIIFITGLTLSFSFWFGQRIFSMFWDLPQEVEVPSLIGEDMNVADNILREKNLSLKVVDSRYQNKYPSNTIIKQDPPGGIMVRKGREITAVVSLGPELADVPDLKGQSTRESKLLLGNAKLAVGNVNFVRNKAAEPGAVLGQNPSFGKKVRVGTSVSLTVNKGEEPMIKVPNLVGMKITEAEKKLKANTMQTGTVVWVWHEYVPKGEVIRQIPNPASMVQPASSVDLKVSAGREGIDFNLKQKDFVFFAPKGEGLQLIKIRQVDDLGDKIVYEGKQAPGGKVELTVHSWGESELQVYYNTKLVRRIRF